MTTIDLLERNQELKKMLQAGPVEVTFTKKDGTERVMKCTINEELITVKPSANTNYTAKLNVNNVRVFDLDKSEWRSFNITSLKGVKIL